VIPTWLTWLVCGAGAMSLAGLFVIALCRVAKNADEMLDEHADHQLAEVLHFDCERRTRRDTRNGLGGAA
jgi:hypothetical protein